LSREGVHFLGWDRYVGMRDYRLVARVGTWIWELLLIGIP
jgi:hypothetical protein